jgi:DNA invertase Pin-like site-specific DNA recombinase
MSPANKRFVTYIRVSTQKQGASGLGLEAQQRAVGEYLRQHGGQVVQEYREVESGKINERPQLQAALKRCRQSKATLLIAKLDRLGRNTAFLMTLRESSVKFICADMPSADETTIGMLAVFAQHERKAISDRTKAALAAAKARGVKLGNPRLVVGTAETAAIARQGLVSKAEAFAEDLRDVIEQAKSEGKRTLKDLADHLTSLSCPTPRGCAWTPTAVSRLLHRLDLRTNRQAA